VLSGCVVLALALPATALDTLLSRPMTAGGGVMRSSSLWVDPTGENDSDNDSIAWASFTLPLAGTVSAVKWWGQAPPSVGFWISFHNQDPNTVASQPDIFRVGAEPIGEEEFASVSATGVGGGLYQMSVNLAAPLHFEADTRYFVSIVGLTPQPWPTWSWAQSPVGTSTFWWVRGAHMYYSLGDARAVELLGTLDAGGGPCNAADLAEAYGLLDLADINAFVAGFVANSPSADLDGNGVFDLGDIGLFITAFVAGCP